MSTLFPNNNAQLDGQKCWDYWWDDGMSLSKVAERLEAEGIVSNLTQRRFTPTAIRHAAWRWALQPENTSHAFEKLKYQMGKRGRIIGDEEWKTIMVENAKFIWHQTPKRLERFLKERNLESYANK